MKATVDSDRIWSKVFDLLTWSSFLFIFSLPFSHSYSLVVGVGPASVMVGNLVAGKRIAQAAGRDLGMIEDQDLVRKVV